MTKDECCEWILLNSGSRRGDTAFRLARAKLGEGLGIKMPRDPTKVWEIGTSQNYAPLPNVKEYQAWLEKHRE